MIRIVALNEEEDSDSDSESEEEVAVTKEAQETIAESEYMRAIKLKTQGKPDLTLSLLTELLETKVLNEILNDDKNEKLWAIRYNCHKNIAIIYEEKGEYEKALQQFILAMQIDDTDVYTLHRFGKLALKNNALELAEVAFEKCLERNPLHYGAADCILEIRCRNHNILGAYGWALKLYLRDPYHKQAERTLREISTKFSHLIPFYEKFWGPAPANIMEREWSEEKDGSVFPEPKDMVLENERLKIQFPADIDKFRITLPNWHSLGRYIVDVYSHLEKTSQSMLFAWKYNEILRDSNNDSETIEKMDIPQECTSAANDSSSSNCNSPEAVAAATTETIMALQESKFEGEIFSQSPKPSIFATPPLTVTSEPNSGEKTPNHDTNSDINDDSKSDGSDVSKPKPRRRCSDLHFLEQWGWHKNRRYSSRKKPQPDRVEVDSSLNGILKKVFAKFTNITFDEDWPFVEKEVPKSETDDDNIDTIKEDLCSVCKSATNLETFQLQTQENFEIFIEKLKSKQFDLMLLIYKWLKYISFSWHIPIPDEIKTLYISIFNIYLRHFDFSTWDQMNSNNYIASYRMGLLYLELDYCQKVREGIELSMDWKNVFNQLMFKSGTAYVILNEKFEPYKLRLANLEYSWCNYGAQYEKCVFCLEHMEEMVNKQNENYILHLPNMDEECINKKIIIKTRTNLQRQIALKTVPKLFKEEKWQELIDIIKANILQTEDNHKCENFMKDMKVQVEILLQAYWNINDYENCIVWAEKFCHYCTCRYLQEKKFSLCQKFWSESVNYIFSYIEALILNEGFEVVGHLEGNLSRLVQNIIRILVYQLDGPIDKNNNPVHELETKRLWVVLHQIMLREENISPVVIKNKTNETEEDEEVIPSSFLVLFTAHEFLGKRQWCTNDNGGILQYTLDSIAPNLRAPLYDVCREAVYEYIEQVTFCLYGYPQKKARSRHLEDHESNNVELTWSKAIQIFDLYRPENLPEFNSYKLESITADMEQLLLKILTLMPVELDPTPATTQILDFINGVSNEQLKEIVPFKLPFKISTIFYLLGDYYFKSRDFSKAIKYYILDLACSPGRFDSWAGVALSKASKIETKLNGLLPIDLPDLMLECEETMRCFERCINLNRNQILLWIEYGSFAYTIHAFCSRYLKQNADKLSMEEFSSAEERKEKMLQIAFNCFSLAANLQNTSGENIDENESHDEKWLCQYMLGKIAEKRKEQPKVYLNYYLTAANYLYENNATYPIKLNHSNPTTLSVEALEVFYRTNSAIIKYLENTKEITRETGDLFNNVLRNLSNSPFAFNKAKIDGNSLNAFKRKIADKIEQSSLPKIAKESPNEEKISPLTTVVIGNKDIVANVTEINSKSTSSTQSPNNNIKSEINIENTEARSKVDETQSNVSPSRRESQESAATATTTTVTSSTTSSTSSTDSSTSDSDSDSDETSTETESKKDKSAPYSTGELKDIYSLVIQNLEECITRFPEHYKSIYRLVYHYINGPTEFFDLSKCEQLLLGQYKTSLGNQINGLFFDRKNNNIFNGIWRIPSSEIDRPGSFSAHLVKCMGLLEHMLMKCNNFQLLTDIGLQLYKTPDNDKRYIKDHDRMELYKQSILLSGQVMRNILKNFIEKRDDEEVLNFLLDIYKTHKKCIKHINQKESIFIQLLGDVYKFFIQDKVEQLPDNLNFYDLAVKLCVQELTGRKALEKNLNLSGSRPCNVNMGDVLLGISTEPPPPQLPPRPIQIPGLPIRARTRNVAPQIKPPVNPNFVPLMTNVDNSLRAAPLSSLFGADILNSPHIMSMMSLLGSTPTGQTDNADFQKLVRDFYKQILENGSKYPLPNINPIQATIASTQPPQATLSLTSSLPAETTITPASLGSKIFPETKVSTQLIPRTTSIQDPMPTSTHINFGLTDLTITPARLTPSTLPIETTKPIQTTNVVNNANIFLQPVPNILTTDLPKSLNSLPQVAQYPIPTTNAPTVTKFQPKGKSAAKSKQTSQKSFDRLVPSGLPNPVTSIADLAKLSPILSTLSVEKQTQILNSYADLLKNQNLGQMHMLPQKAQRAAPKRKPKAQLQPVVQQPQQPIISNISTSTTFTPITTQPIQLQHQQQQQQQQQQQSQQPIPILPTLSSFHIPTFDSNIMTISAISTTAAASVTSTTSSLQNQNFSMPTSSSTSQGMSNIYTQQSNIQISPTKTLQQKLAERQKANQLIEANTNTTGQRKPSIDVIILD